MDFSIYFFAHLIIHDWYINNKNNLNEENFYASIIALTENRYEDDVNFRHENLNVFFLSMQEKIN